MKLNDCPNESSVLAALANESMNGELEAHLQDCPVCQEAKLVWTFLHEYTTEDRHAEIAPAGIIWWRARLARKRVEALRSVAFIESMQKIALAVAAVVAIAIAVWQAPRLLEMPRVLLAGSAAVLILLVASLIAVFALGQDSQRRALPRSM
jgi:hypothetical protein